MLGWLLENRLFIKPEKREFYRAAVSFLGYILRQGQLTADPAKFKAVAEARKQLQCFLGFANFYC